MGFNSGFKGLMKMHPMWAIMGQHSMGSFVGNERNDADVGCAA
jgi:hypothetical protein